MARTEVVEWECDLPRRKSHNEEQRRKNVRTITFSIGSSGPLEMELCETHTEKMRRGLAPFIACARPVGATTRRRRAQRPRTNEDRRRSAAIRSWAEGQGIEVPARGRISPRITAMYDAAH